MASLASLTASEIISLTPDENLDMNEKEMQEPVEQEIDMAAAARGSFNRISNDNNNNDNNGSASVSFCTSGSMHGTIYSYALQNAEMHGSSVGGGGGMIMYMDGFRISLKGGQPCLNLYFESWTLDTRSKFLLAMLFVLLLGIVTEFISKLRFQVSKQQRRRRYKRMLISCLHGLQALVGYILMLATMTFSVELFASVLLGLGMGYSLFYSDEDWHVTTNPCCNYMQDEAKERNEEAKLEIQIQREEATNEQEEVEVDLFHVARQDNEEESENENRESTV